MYIGTSVKNFLLHLEKLESESAYEKIYKQLSNYFDLIDEKLIEDRNNAIMHYEKYIMPIAKTFEEYIHFHLVIKTRFITLICFFLSIVLYAFKSSFYYYLFLIAIYISIYFRQLYYERQKKTYGPFF